MIYNSTPAQKKGLEEFDMTLRKMLAEGVMIGVRAGMNDMKLAQTAARSARIVYRSLFPELAMRITAKHYAADYPNGFEVSKIVAGVAENGCILNENEASLVCAYIHLFLDDKDSLGAVDYDITVDAIMVLLNTYLKYASEEIRCIVVPWMVFHDL